MANTRIKGKTEITNTAPTGGDPNNKLLDTDLMLLEHNPNGNPDEDRSVKLSELRTYVTAILRQELQNGTLVVKKAERDAEGHDIDERFTDVEDDIDTLNDDDSTTGSVANKIKTAINALDVNSQGGAGKYIQSISETDGKISATAQTMDTAPTANSTKAVTSGGVKTALDGKLNTSLKGANSGLAELDANGKVPSSQLPSYVDDVIEYSSVSAFPATGEGGKIYVATGTNKTYRWSGSEYVVIASDLALGETSASAYRGDRGKTAYDHSQTTSGNPHNVTKSDVELGNCDNTADANKNVATAIGMQAVDCTTAGDNPAKEVSLAGFTLFKGARLIINLVNKNTVANATLNVNNTGAKTIRLNSSNVNTSNFGKAYWYCWYDGTYWNVETDKDAYRARICDAATVAYQTRQTAGCSTASNQSEKVFGMNNFSNSYTKSTFLVWIQNPNSYLGKLTVKCNGQTAKDLYINGTITSATNCTLPAGIWMCTWDGDHFNIETQHSVTDARYAMYLGSPYKYRDVDDFTDLVESVEYKQPKTLSSPITVAGTICRTVETALDEINTLADDAKTNADDAYSLANRKIGKSGTLTSGNLLKSNGTAVQDAGISATNVVTLSGAQTVSGNKTFTGTNTHSGQETFSGKLVIPVGTPSSYVNGMIWIE